MLARRGLPQWQLLRRAGTARNLRISSRAQHTAQQSSRSSPNNTRPDSAETENVNIQASAATPITSPSVTRRLFRGILYAAIFSLTGFVVIWGWSTYRYLKIGQVLDNPKLRQRDREWFVDSINKSALVQNLKKEGWIEEDPKQHELNIDAGAVSDQSTSTGRHLVHERLNNDGYLVERHFRHPTDALTVVVFVAGFGCESWPNTLHGGIATTVIQDALDTHIKNFPDYAPFRKRDTSMNYKVPLHTGTLYSVLVQNDHIEQPSSSSNAAKAGLIGVGASFEIRRMVKAPEYVDRHDEKTGTTSRICKTFDAQKGFPPAVKGGSVLLLAPKTLRGTFGKITGDVNPELQTKLDSWIQTYRGIKMQNPVVPT